MRDIPQWIEDLASTEKFNCNNCKQVFSKENIIFIGVKQEEDPKSDNKDKNNLCIGMLCRKCHELTIFGLQEMSLIDFAFEILDGDSGGQEVFRKDNRKEDKPDEKTMKKDPNKNIAKSKITAKELKEISEFLGKINNHEEMLIAMGFSNDEISMYNKKGD